MPEMFFDVEELERMTEYMKSVMRVTNSEMAEAAISGYDSFMAGAELNYIVSSDGESTNNDQIKVVQYLMFPAYVQGFLDALPIEVIRDEKEESESE